MNPPLVLDTDDAVLPLPDEIRIVLPPAWRESMRFGCSMSAMRLGVAQMQAQMPGFERHGTVFMGSGDFHHLSWPLIERCLASQVRPGGHRLRVIVLDNHPDNMRFPWGVHCGSWVGRVALLPQVEHVHVVGITSADIGAGHAWEHRLAALQAGKLTYWSVGVNTRWAHWLGLGRSFQSFADGDAMIAAVCHELAASQAPAYLSVDKDAFAPSVVRTNWDQGCMQAHHAEQILAALRGSLVGSDVTGEISTWHYATRWKRWLSAADGQDTGTQVDDLADCQAGQAAFNLRLLGWMRGSWVSV